MTINTKCSTHLREQCGECYILISGAEHEKLTFYPTIALSPFDQIGKVDWKCQHHGDSRFLWACVECVKEQLAKEYERGKREAAQPEAESKKFEELREMLTRERVIHSNNYRELCDLKKDYATLKQHHEKAREQIEIAHRIVNALRPDTLFSPSLRQALKNWEAL